MTKPIQIKNLTIGSGIPKVCVPLTGRSKEEICKEAEAARDAGADLIEWRADFYEALENREKTAEILSALADILGQIPLLFTIRTKKEGGNRQITTEDYVNYNLSAADTGKAALIDVEAFGDEGEKETLIKALREKGVRVIASYHNFDKTEDRDALLERFKIMDKTGADILKIAAMPHEFDDVAAIMQVTNSMTDRFTDKPLIAISMGSLGSMSRIAGENFGSAVTFATVGKASAPGQFPIMELRMMMEALHAKNV